MFDITLIRFSLIALSVSCGALFGCASQPTQVDLQFGMASKVAFLGQQAVPDTAHLSAAARTVDGLTMKSAIDRYQKSFETLPLPINIFNIGVGTPMPSSSQR